MAKLPSIVTGISVTAEWFKKVANDNICEKCVTSKQSRLPFASLQSKTSRPLELVHMDVCGPMQEASLGGNKYVATFLDDYTELSIVVPVPSKVDVIPAVKSIRPSSCWGTRAGNSYKWCVPIVADNI